MVEFATRNEIADFNVSKKFLAQIKFSIFYAASSISSWFFKLIFH
jgi:hypothetical protein